MHANNIKNRLSLKLLVVDDEYLIREGIKYIIPWHDFGVDTIEVADNGVTALEIVESYCPDIVITDIKMPQIDGLTLIGELKKIVPDAAFIIISGFDDFNYAKEALSYGVFAYILKPIQKNELSKIIQKVLMEITQKNLKHKRLEEIESKLKTSMPMLQEHAIESILNSCCDKTDIYRYLQDYEIDIENNCYSIVCIKYTSSNSSVPTRVNLLTTIKTVLSKRTDGNSARQVKYFSLFINNVSVTLISAADEQTLETSINECFSEVYDKLTNISNMIRIASGSIKNDIADVYKSYNEALSCFEYLPCSKDNKIIYYKALSGENTNLIKITEVHKKAITRSISDSCLGSLSQVLMDLKTSMQNNGFISQLEVFTLIRDILNTCMELFKDDTNYLQLSSRDTSINSILSCFNNLDDIFDWLSQYLKNLMLTFSSSSKKNPKKKLIQNIERYVEDNISCNINLNEIALKLFYNPSYISRVFKEELNKNFLDFVIDKKIDYAKKLISETDLKLYEICKKVGYKDYKYFSNLFKKVVGVAPNDYKASGYNKT